MTRFNVRPSGLIVPSPIVSTASPTARTGNNAPGFVRDPKSELFLLGVANFVGQDTFYEKGKVRDQRFLTLVHHVSHEDPEWLGRFLPWLRNEANMRSASMIGAVEAARIMTHHKIPGGRQIVNSVLRRADEPGEALAYWLQTQPGRQIPKPIKRGIADGAARLYNQYTTLKYDTESHSVRFGDVLELCHVAPSVPEQTTLFRHLIDRRHKREGVPSSLTMIHKNRWLREQVARGRTALLLDASVLREAGMTWEDVLSLAGSNGDKKSLWEAMIPSMGYMALLRNLRGFSEAGIDVTAAAMVTEKLANADEVTRSRQLPMRFLSAYNAAGQNLQWAWPLEQALQLSLRNVPQLRGNTLILIDTSGSMGDTFSKDGTLKRWDAAAMFGLALAQRCDQVTVVSFSNHSAVFPMTQGASLLTLLNQFKQRYFFNGGTNTAGTVRHHWNNSFDRIIVLTDEQADTHYGVSVFDAVPANKMAISFNLAGYRVGHAESGSAYRVTIGGLTDQAFRLLPILEQRAAGQWPF